MQIERIAVVLRPRSQWEAMELGIALVRNNAAAIWKAWLLVTLPIFVAVNAFAAVFDKWMLALFAMWWLKPLFDRIVLHVLSRAVFGDVPALRETLKAQLRWGLPRPLLDHLTWRRLSAFRSLTLPVDLLEGGDAAQRAQRRSVIGGRASGHAAALMLVCIHFELILLCAPLVLFFMFVPPELLPDTWAGFRDTIMAGLTPGMELGYNALAWFATTVIEPFYVGAGFGLYINRRTELEAWDVEIALRRMRARLLKLAGGATVLLVLAFMPQANAQPVNPQNAVHGRPQASTEPVKPARALEATFGEPAASQQALGKAMQALKDDAELHPRKQIRRWVFKDTPPLTRNRPNFQFPEWMGAVGRLFVGMGQMLAWGIIGLVAVLLLWWLVRNWPHLRGARHADANADEVRIEGAELPESLPADVPSAVRRLWQQGQQRQALALLYRAAVEAMVARTQVLLVPGATEAECLRAARQLADEGDRTQFRQLVRTWQYAAYAHELPSDGDFETLLAGVSRSFGWAR